MKLTPRRRKIAELFDEIEADFPSKSDEWLIAMTCDRFLQAEGHEINNADVCEALIAQGEAKDRQKSSASKQAGEA